MTHPTFMVHTHLNQRNGAILNIAGALAERFEAHAVGIAACQSIQLAYDGGYGYVSGDVVQADRDEDNKEFQAAEDEFRNALHNRAKSLSFRSELIYGPLSEYLACQARCADLMITRFDKKKPLFDTSRYVDPGDLLMSIGRPVLNIPEGVDNLSLEHVLVAWKDSPETRRAVFNALPYLKAARRVTVLEVAAERYQTNAKANVADVAAWLERHGIGARALVETADADDAVRIANLASALEVDLIVAGAYGHHRLRELALGGVTRDFLIQGDTCSLLSH